EPVVSRVRADRLHCLVAGDVADHRHDSITELHRANELKRVFLRQVANGFAGAVRGEHELSECRIVHPVVAAQTGVARLESVGDELGAVAVDGGAVARVELNEKHGYAIVARGSMGLNAGRIGWRLLEVPDDETRRPVVPKVDVGGNRLCRTSAERTPADLRFRGE